MNASKKNKRLIGAILLLFVAIGAAAQTPDLLFEKPFPYQIQTSYLSFANKPYCYIMDVFPEDGSEGFCLMTVNHQRQCFSYETESVSPPLVYKVSEQGELLGELTLGYENRHSFVYDIYKSPDDPRCFLAVGFAHDNDLHYDRPFMAKFNQDLDLLWRREIELPEPYKGYLSFGSMMGSDGRIFCSSYLYDCSTGGSQSRFCFRLTPEGELDGLFDSPFQSAYQKVLEYPDGSGDYGLLENMEQDNQLLLLRINRNMELVSQQTIPDSYFEMDPINPFPNLYFALTPPQYSTSGRHAVVLAPDGSLILANEVNVTYQYKTKGIDNYYGIGFLRVSPEGEALSCAMDGEKPTHDSLVMITPVLPVGDDSFYFVYAMGLNGGYDYMNCFVVGKMDWEGNLLWRRYWNRYQPEYDMKVYYPQDAATSHDDGCLVTGFSFNSNINATGSYTYQPDVFLLKFFADGTLSVPEMEPLVRPFTFWPNPSSNWLMFEFSPDVLPDQVELYDLQGRLLRTQRKDLESVNMEGLPSGTYSLRVVMHDGNTYSEKVVKQ